MDIESLILSVLIDVVFEIGFPVFWLAKFSPPLGSALKLLTEINLNQRDYLFYVKYIRCRNGVILMFSAHSVDNPAEPSGATLWLFELRRMNECLQINVLCKKEKRNEEERTYDKIQL